MANVLWRKSNHGQEFGGTRKCPLRTRSLIAVSCKLNSDSYHFLETKPESCSHVLSFVQAWPSPFVHNSMSSYLLQHDLSYPSPYSLLHNLSYFHSLLTLSLLVLFDFLPTLFLFTLGNTWLKFSAFLLIVLSTFLHHRMKGLSPPTLRLNAISCPSPFLISAVLPAPSHFHSFLEELKTCLYVSSQTSLSSPTPVITLAVAPS